MEYVNEEFLSTDGELVELANFLLECDENNEDVIEYNGVIYKITSTVQPIVNDLIKKRLTVSKDNKSLIITAFVKMYNSNNPNQSLSFEFKNSDGNKHFYLKNSLKDFKNSINFKFRFGCSKNDKEFIGCNFDKTLSVADGYKDSKNRESFGKYYINKSFIEYADYDYGFTQIKYSIDGNKVLKINTNSSIINDNSNFLINKLSTYEKLEKFDPDKAAASMSKKIKEIYPSYYSEPVKNAMSSYFSKLKDAVENFYDQYLLEVQDIVSLRNTFLGELSEDINGKYLYFSKDELQHVISFFNGNNISKGSEKELLKMPNKVAQYKE